MNKTLQIQFYIIMINVIQKSENNQNKTILVASSTVAGLLPSLQVALTWRSVKWGVSSWITLVGLASSPAPTVTPS